MGRGLLPAPSCALPRHAGVGSREQAQPPFPRGGGAPPALGGRRAAPVAPLLRWVRGGGGGGGAAPSPAPGSVRGGGGGLGGALWPPGDASRRPWGGGRGRHGGPGPGGQPSARGSRPSPVPPIESWMPAQALAGALTSPAVAALRRPAGSG